MKNYIQKVIILVITISLFLASICLAKTGTIQNSDFLNLRESPSTSANLLTKMPKDASFEILEENGDWYKIKYQDYTGYVSKQYVKVNEEVANTNIAPKANSKGIINKTSDVYILPLLNSSKIGNITSNTEVLVVSITGKWAYVQNDSISGWMYANNVNGTEEQNSTENETNENNENQGNQETTDSKDNEEQENNTITNNDEKNTVEENNNAQTSNNDSTSKGYPKTMYINVEAVYVRAKPTTESDTVASVGPNTPVTVKGEEGDWYKVEVSDGSGYMMKKYLSSEKQ